MGGLEFKSKSSPGATAPYFATSSEEVFFHVSTRMSVTDDLSHKVAVVTYHGVVVQLAYSTSIITNEAVVIIIAILLKPSCELVMMDYRGSCMFALYYIVQPQQIHRLACLPRNKIC